ncbi:MAG: Fe-S protein assembly chaperone HscA [Pseudomonadales bacterium]|nr:Fe-S protein assembly chaperone HscA [Pseudomonadales bacterium]
MALLQISEPGGKPAKPAHRLAVGIDLGTTNSLVSASCGGKIEILPDDDGSYLLPSVVRYRADGEIIVGNEAKQSAAKDPGNTIASVKRWLGKSQTEIAASDHAARYQFDPDREQQAPALVTAAGSKDPVQVSADILRSLVERAEACLKGKLEGAVITVPAYFNDAQRQQTKDAAQLAGVKVLRLLNEPTAAAVAYGLDSKEQGTVVVFDLGGGTFDVSLLSLRQGVFEVLATGGDTALGGDDFDQALADYLRARIDKQASEEASELVVLHQYANQLKHDLGENDSVDIDFNGYRGSLSRAEFADICEPLVKRTINTCRRVLRDAGKTTEDIDNIVLVGGATRMPVIREAVADYFGKAPLTDIDPDKAVAVGAGIQADVLIGNKSSDDFLLLDVNPLSLGIETMGELVEKIIPRNTTIPVAKAQEFTTFKDGQTAMSLHVVQGERELVSDCRSLARFELRGIPPMVAGAAKIRVTFQVDADGLLSVIAEELSTGSKSEIQIKPSYGLDADTIEQMLQASHEHASEDRDIRALREAQIEAQQIIDAIYAAIDADGELLEESEKASIEAAIAELRGAMQESKPIRIQELSEELNRLSGDFAARRMDLHIRSLQGESIDSVEPIGK